MTSLFLAMDSFFKFAPEEIRADYQSEYKDLREQYERAINEPLGYGDCDWIATVELCLRDFAWKIFFAADDHKNNNQKRIITEPAANYNYQSKRL